MPDFAKCYMNFILREIHFCGILDLPLQEQGYWTYLYRNKQLDAFILVYTSQLSSVEMIKVCQVSLLLHAKMCTTQ
jgi:hypothetical protein